MFWIQADIRFSVRKIRRERKKNTPKSYTKDIFALLEGFHLKCFLEFDLIIVLYIAVSMLLHKLYGKMFETLGIAERLLLYS